MPQLEYFVVSESVSLDANRNTVSIFHVLNKIGLEPIPGAIPMLSAVAGWVFSKQELADKAESQVKLEFKLPGSDAPKVFRANLQANVRFQNLHLELQEVPISDPGDLIVTLFVDDEPKAHHTIEIVGIPS